MKFSLQRIRIFITQIKSDRIAKIFKKVKNNT